MTGASLIRSDGACHTLSQRLGSVEPGRIAIHFEATYGERLAVSRVAEPVVDPATARSVHLAMAWREGTVIEAACLDLQELGDSALLELRGVLSIPTVHGVQEAAFCYLRMNWPLPDEWEDTLELTRLQHLGREVDDDSLLSVAARAKISHRYAGERAVLVRSKTSGARFTQREREYAIEDARVTLQVAEHLEHAFQGYGCRGHRPAVELGAYVAEVARIVVAGIRLDESQCVLGLRAARKAQAEALSTLERFDLRDLDDDRAVLAALRRAGVDHLLKNGGSPPSAVLDRDRLGELRGTHPLFSGLHNYRRWTDVLRSKLFTGGYSAGDGQVYPQYRAIGAATGRTTTARPNIQGLPRVLRPVVAARPGFGILDVDYAQAEVGIAAAVFADPVLTADYNSGDVYERLATVFFPHDPEDARARAKTLALGMLYGLEDDGLARKLGVVLARARAVRRAFLDRLPILVRNQQVLAERARRFGFSQSITGVRRHRTNSGPLSPRERRWIVNHAVQGSGADVLRRAVVALGPGLRKLEGRILVLLHDAVVIEAPLDRLAEVAMLVEVTMVQAMADLFPALNPRVTVNCSAPSCWNEKGRSDSIERLLQDLRWRA